MMKVEIGGVMVDVEELEKIDQEVMIDLVSDHGGSPAEAIEAAATLWVELVNPREMVEHEIEVPPKK